MNGRVMHRGCLPVSTRDYRYSWVCVTAAVWVCMQLCVCLCCGSKKRHDSTAQSRNQRQNYFGVFLVVSCTSGWSGQICNNVKQWAIKNRSEAKNTDRPVVLIFFLCVCVCVCVFRDILPAGFKRGNNLSHSCEGCFGASQSNMIPCH